ncbi:hypothetical protein Tco_0170861, partial [Tanacetum coccineum]
ALMFVPQKELSGDQAYWLSANDITSQASKSATPATPFVRKSRPPSQVLTSPILKDQLQRKDDTIRNLETHINIMRILNVGPTTGSLDQQALETEVTQLKEALTSFQIQNDGYKIENAKVNRRYIELSTASTHSRTILTGKMAILNAEIAKLKAEVVGKKNSGPTELVKPKVLASMMYTKSS